MEKILELEFQEDREIQDNPVKFFRDLSARMRRYALVNSSKPRNYFKVVPEVENELNSP